MGGKQRASSQIGIMNRTPVTDRSLQTSDTLSGIGTKTSSARRSAMLGRPSPMDNGGGSSMERGWTFFSFSWEKLQDPCPSLFRSFPSQACLHGFHELSRLPCQKPIHYVASSSIPFGGTRLIAWTTAGSCVLFSFLSS